MLHYKVETNFFRTRKNFLGISKIFLGRVKIYYVKKFCFSVCKKCKICEVVFVAKFIGKLKKKKLGQSSQLIHDIDHYLHANMLNERKYAYELIWRGQKYKKNQQ